MPYQRARGGACGGVGGAPRVEGRLPRRAGGAGRSIGTECTRRAWRRVEMRRQDTIGRGECNARPPLAWTFSMMRLARRLPTGRLDRRRRLSRHTDSVVAWLIDSSRPLASPHTLIHITQASRKVRPGACVGPSVVAASCSRRGPQQQPPAAGQRSRSRSRTKG